MSVFLTDFAIFPLILSLSKDEKRIIRGALNAIEVNSSSVLRIPKYSVSSVLITRSLRQGRSLNVRMETAFGWRIMGKKKR
jgi:hypothetical protein